MTSPARAQRDNNLRAFDVVDYLLYVMATAIFVRHALPIVVLSKNAIDILVSDIFILGFVITVFLRNYVVMHALDNWHEHADLAFMSLYEGGRYRMERVLRALIVFIVITTPKGAFDFITNFVASISTGARIGAAFLVPGLFSFNLKTPHIDIINFFSYYSVILFALFVLFILWDLVAVQVVRKAVKDGKIQAFQEKGAQKCCDVTVSALLVYMNVAHRTRADGVSTLSWRSPIYHESGQARVEAANFYSVYLFSLKMWERTFGLLVALAVFCWAASDCNSQMVVLVALPSGIYLTIAFQNQGYLAQMGRVFRLMPLREYWRPTQPR